MALEVVADSADDDDFLAEEVDLEVEEQGIKI